MDAFSTGDAVGTPSRFKAETSTREPLQTRTRWTALQVKQTLRGVRPTYTRRARSQIPCAATPKLNIGAAAAAIGRRAAHRRHRTGFRELAVLSIKAFGGALRPVLPNRIAIGLADARLSRTADPIRAPWTCLNRVSALVSRQGGRIAWAPYCQETFNEGHVQYLSAQGRGVVAERGHGPCRRR